MYHLWVLFCEDGCLGSSDLNTTMGMSCNASFGYPFIRVYIKYDIYDKNIDTFSELIKAILSEPARPSRPLRQLFDIVSLVRRS